MDLKINMEKPKSRRDSLNCVDSFVKTPETSLVELNIGGQIYTSTLFTLTKESDSLLGMVFSPSIDKSIPLLKDPRGRYFIDRDGQLFRFILDYLRNDKLTLPEGFAEKQRLLDEASYYRLGSLVKELEKLVKYGDIKEHSHFSSSAHNDINSANRNENDDSDRAPVSNIFLQNDVTKKTCGYITIGYRGTFAFGRDGLADIQFRKVIRILVHGKVSLCREVFGSHLNESRDPDRGNIERYSSRFFLKYNSVEQAFDTLAKNGFKLESSCASSANGNAPNQESDNEEDRWLHYTEFIFYRS